jgi:light-regulated signal transduction histidine kinase (bacteriophytochrome)
LTEKHDLKKPLEQFAFFMDILGHDILNNNQAVLGYLELILAEPGFEKKVRKYAEKAVPHIRTSTLLVENIKKVLATRDIEPSSLKPIDLMGPVSRAPKNLERFFPDKTIKVSVNSKVEKAWVMGNSAVNDLVDNTLVDTVKLDPGRSVGITIKLTEHECGGYMCWSVRIENPNAALPPIVRDREIESIYREDSSTAVRVVGMLFAKMITSNMGGDFNAKELRSSGEKRGVVFTITLRKADGK